MPVIVCSALCLLLSFVAAAEEGCENIRQEYLSRRLDATTDPGGGVCLTLAPCCTPYMEAWFLAAARKDFKNMVASATEPLRNNIWTALAFLKDSVRDKQEAALNATLRLMGKMYTGDAKLSPLEPDLSKLFDELFPVAYAQGLRTSNFSPALSSCLRRQRASLRPFGPGAEDLERRAFQAARALNAVIDGLGVAAGVLDLLAAEDTRPSTECLKAVARLTSCSRCQGGSGVAPCTPFCRNVLRGCLAPLTTPLERPWQSLVGTLHAAVVSPGTYLETLSLLRILPGVVAEGLRYAAQSLPALIPQVRELCGGGGGASTETHVRRPTVSQGLPLSRAERDSTLQTRVQVGVAQLSPELLTGLGDLLCSPPPAGEACWNGRSMGEYVQAVATKSEDNPEVPPPESSDTNAIALAARIEATVKELRGVVSAAAAPVAQPYTAEGSGWGRSGPDDDDDDEDHYGSGSGDWDPGRPGGYRTKTGGEADFNFETTSDHRYVSIKGPSAGASRWTSGHPTLISIFIIVLLR